MSGKNDSDQNRDLSRRNILLAGTTFAALSALNSAGSAQTQQGAQQQPATPANRARKPNILVIFGDDIGIANISAYSHGLMGYTTPNIDRIARDGIMFLH